MNEEKRKLILAWYEKADHDIIMSKRGIEIAPFVLDSACFHCQQAVEKYLKAYILYQGKEIIKTHNLEFLKETCAEYDYDFEDLDFKDLNSFSSDIRYPDDALLPTIEEAKEYLQVAEDIKELVRKKIIFT